MGRIIIIAKDVEQLAQRLDAHCENADKTTLPPEGTGIHARTAGHLSYVVLPDPVEN